jgi:hypothetical protein
MFAFENEDKIAKLHEGQMNSLQILEKAGYPPFADEMDFDTFLRKFYGWITQPNNKLIQIENTLFMVTIINKDVCEIKIISADNEKDAIQTVSAITKTLRKQGFKKMTGFADDKKYVDLAKKTGLNFNIQPQTKMVNGQPTQGYSFELDL